jgi:hypothetical protein
MSFISSHPFPAGVAVDAVRFLPLLCGGAVSAAPLDPAGAGVPAGGHHAAMGGGQIR